MSDSERIVDTYGHRGLGGYCSPEAGPCVCAVCNAERASPFVAVEPPPAELPSGVNKGEKITINHPLAELLFTDRELRLTQEQVLGIVRKLGTIAALRQQLAEVNAARNALIDLQKKLAAELDATRQQLAASEQARQEGSMTPIETLDELEQLATQYEPTADCEYLDLLFSSTDSLISDSRKLRQQQESLTALAADLRREAGVSDNEAKINAYSDAADRLERILEGR